MFKSVRLLAPTLLTLGISSAAFAGAPPPAAAPPAAAPAAAPSPAAAAPAQAQPKAPAPAKAAPLAQLDINSATDAELRALPGMDEVTLKKLMEGRPYANKAQLVSKKIMGRGEYTKIEKLVVARQPAAPAKPAAAAAPAAPAPAASAAAAVAPAPAAPAASAPPTK